MATLVFQATLGGQVNLNGPNTASTFNIAVPATTGNMVTTGDSGTVTGGMLASSISLVTPNLGTPTSGTMTYVTGLPLTTGVTGILPVANGGTGVSTSTGTGNSVLSTSPTITSPTITSPTINGTPVMGASIITRGTAVASTSGTSIDFTSIPSWVKRVTILYGGVSTSGTNNYQIQLGTGATPTYTTTGYASTLGANTTSSAAASNASTGFVHTSPNAASQLTSGQLVITNLTGNVWICFGVTGATAGPRAYTNSGSITLGAVLTAVRITTVGGTDTFNAGSINILYE